MKQNTLMYVCIISKTKQRHDRLNFYLLKCDHHAVISQFANSAYDALWVICHRRLEDKQPRCRRIFQWDETSP